VTLARMPEVSREAWASGDWRRPPVAGEVGLALGEPAGLVEALGRNECCDAGMHVSLLSLESTWESTAIRMR